ncbi:hypothetical protein ACFYNO_37950 [Kitasatospora sp. NPDC006697]|uniref:hypothetical protein n=1 Tax=Kitasatospora sp. NPDC006697 TaxID=3364020 RepID=UPI00369D3662
MRSTLVRILALATAVTALVLPAAAPAGAEPPPGTVPQAHDVVGVGAPLTGTLFDQASTDYDAYVLNSGTGYGSPLLYSWDSWGLTGSYPFTAKSGAYAIQRPSSTDQGIAALNSSTSAEFDYVRAERSLLPTDPATDYFVNLAEDSVGWAANSNGNAPAGLSSADLVGIYTCSILSWNQITDVPGYSGLNVPIDPMLPQPGLELRTTFLRLLGFTGPATPGACVNTSDREDEGTGPVIAGNPNAIVPYSVAHWIGQVYRGRGTGLDNAGRLVLGSLDGISPVGADHAMNPAYVRTRYGYLVSDVVRAADWNGGTPALQNVFGPHGWFCANPLGEADLAAFGFAPLLPGVSCGAARHN